MTRAPSDADIWREIRDLDESTGWPPSAIKDAVAMKMEIDVARVAQVWRERIVNFG